MNRDAATRALLRAAYLVECSPPDRSMISNYTHPLRYVSAASPTLRTYHAAGNRLLSCNGTDLLDLDRDEKIDILVAAAFWDDDAA